MKQQNTIYLLKMGADTQDGRNHRIRLVSNNFIYKKQKCELCIDFTICTPYTVKTTKAGKTKIIRPKLQDQALWCEVQYTTESGTFGLLINYNYDQYKNCNINIPDLQHYEQPYERYLVYSNYNILKIINYLLKSNFSNIVLVDKIKNYDTFLSDNFNQE